MTETKKSITYTVPICKVDDEQQIVYGWASVIEEKGEIVKDYQGHVIREAELVKAAQRFMSTYRIGKEGHAGAKTGDIVESIVFTRELQKSLGIDLGKVGWFIGYKVADKDVWKKVKEGDYTSFSIGGVGVLTELDDGEE